MKIQNLTLVKEDQMRIAVSLVQNIPYAESEKNLYYLGTLYLIIHGILMKFFMMEQEFAGEKSELLAFFIEGDWI